MIDQVDMKGDWDRRAFEGAESYIAGYHAGQPDEFRESGRRDVDHFFSGLEHVLGADCDAVDIGCGIGRMDEFVAPLVRSLCGVDVSGEMVRRARERLEHCANARFVECDGVSLPLPEESADLVFSHIVFMHMPRHLVPRYFAEAARVLRAGGHFVFQLPRRTVGTPSDPPDQDTFQMRFWDEDEVLAHLAAASLLAHDRTHVEVGLPGERSIASRYHATKPA